MTRAEEKAREIYPFSEGKVQSSFGTISFDQHHDEREGFIKGYEQAIKDIWHNVKDEQPIDGERLLLINRNGEYGTVMLMMPILHKEFSKWEKWEYIKDLIPNE